MHVDIRKNVGAKKVHDFHTTDSWTEKDGYSTKSYV